MVFRRISGKDSPHAGDRSCVAARESASASRHAPGQRAEREVGELLTQLLLDGCLVLNDVPFPYGNLDHVVIRLRPRMPHGYAGQVRPDITVFLIETKSHRGKVTWNGKQLLINGRPFSRNPICQINRSIRWVRRMAKQLCGVNPWIVAVLVFPNADVLIRRSVKRVNVMGADNLLEFIRSYPIKSQIKKHCN